MLVTPPFGASSNIALWRAYSKPPVELVVADLDAFPERRKSCVCGGTFLHEGIDCIEQNPVIGIPDSQNLLCFLFAGVIK